MVEFGAVGMTSPKHPKAQSYSMRGIFDGLNSFRELEPRIGGFATAQERGEAFEVFAEGYLATVAVKKAKQVWPGLSVPHSLRKRLVLTLRDNGVDGSLKRSLVITTPIKLSFAPVVHR